MKRTKVLAATAAISLAAVGIGGIASADTGTSTTVRASFMSNFINAIAQRFNLAVSDVQQVFNQQRAQQKTQMEANRQQALSNRLSNLVSQGKLTQDQANKILAEEASVKAQIDALQGKTAAERKTAMQQIITSVQQWAKDNNIPQQYLMFGFGGRMGMGRMMGWGHGLMRGHGNWTSTSPTPTPTP